MTAQNMAKKILADSGYEVTTVSNGAAAVKKIAEVKPDLVILDIYMPGYTGLEVCERVRANLETTNLPVLLTVGKMEPYRPEDGARVRADGIIVKPFEATDLLGIVKKLSEKFPPADKNATEVVDRTIAQGPEDNRDADYGDSKIASAVDIPAEMAVAPVMALEELPVSNGNAPVAMEWASSVPAMEAVPHGFVPTAPLSFTPVHSEAEPGTITDSMPAYVESEAASQPTSSFELETFAPPAETSADSVSSPEIEFTSAPQAGDVQVEQAPEFEPTVRVDETPIFETAQDPALVTEPDQISQFVTAFGVENAEEVPVGTVTGNEPFFASEPAPDAPETLDAADVFPSSSLESMDVTVEPTVVEVPEENVEVPASEPALTGEAEPATSKNNIDDFEARVAAAMSAFDEPLDGSSFAADSEPVLEQVDTFVGDPEIENPVAAQPEPAPIEATPAPEPEPVPAMDARRTLDVNETMVLPAEALLSLEAEMRKAMDLKKASEPPEPEVLSSEQVMASFTGGPEAPSTAVSESEPATEVPAETVSEPEPTPVAIGESDAAPALALAAAAAAVPSLDNWQHLGEEKLASAVQTAVERLKPQLIAEIVKALKGE